MINSYSHVVKYTMNTYNNMSINNAMNTFINAMDTHNTLNMGMY